MATLLLTAVGTALGGPLGGAIGALAGRSIDGAIFGGGGGEGPRLKELAVTTSSYGQPVARQHGQMRAAGTIIWATDLVEHKARSGGGKGQPSVTSYAYTSSFAVALSSRPIERVGRIWADGNLLRGAAGDLKLAGAMRVHRGRGDQAPDPLIEAAEGPDTPAFRDCAYVVFEDLALEEFGNRIPALSFELFADDGAISLAALIEPAGGEVAAASASLAPLAGYANDGGPISATLEAIDTLFPLSIDAGGARLSVGPASAPAMLPPLLPPPARAWDEGDFGLAEGRRHEREAGDRPRIAALRYYDVARDFQPGVQRPAGRAPSGAPRTIEFPGALTADDARALVGTAARRGGWRRDTLQWRMAELDPAIGPGTDVRVPGTPGLWRIESWEWRERGVELALVRRDPGAVGAIAADAGAVRPPIDEPLGPTLLRAFELPAADNDAGAPFLFAAAGGSAGWSGAALFTDRAGELVPVGRTGRSAATIARLAAPLAGSPGLVFERAATLELALPSGPAGFVSTSLAGVLSGANRLLVGGEVLQFALADEIEPGRWRLTGLLRGRGGTEGAAFAGHPAGTAAVLIDETLTAVDLSAFAPGAPATLAAIGVGDTEPVYAMLDNAGLGRRPPCPVHPRAIDDGDGLALGWVRRARGAWGWADGVDAPLVEEIESYRVGVGPADSPFAEWTTGAPELRIAAVTRDSLAAAHPRAPVWVRQVGRFAQSEPLLLTSLA